MKILVVNYRDRLHPAAGGAEMHLHKIFSRIAALGNCVVLLTTAFANCKRREIVDNITVVRTGSDLLFQFAVAKNLNKLDKEFNFDIIVEDLNKLPLFTPFFTKKKVVVQMHHLWLHSIFYEAPLPIAIAVWLFERTIPFCYKKEHFIVVSPSTKSELSQIGISKSRISVIYNGAENVLNMPVAKATEPYFLWLSRVHRYKGIWVALKAFKEFAQPNVKLTIAGDGPLLKKLPAWLKKNSLTDKVEILGYVSAQKKRELMQNALALLQTSFKEGWGLTVIEAAKLGTPTIASNVAGLKDSVKDNVTGLLFGAGNYSECAQKMLLFYNNSDLRKNLSVAAKNYADSFSWDTAAKETLELLHMQVHFER